MKKSAAYWGLFGAILFSAITVWGLVGRMDANDLVMGLFFLFIPAIQGFLVFFVLGLAVETVRKRHTLERFKVMRVLASVALISFIMGYAAIGLYFEYKIYSIVRSDFNQEIL